MSNSVCFYTQVDFISNYHKKLKESLEKIKKELPIINGRKSKSLRQLSDKIEHMVIYIGCGNSVGPMLESIVFRGKKKLTQPHYRDDGEFLGYGHFRWDWKAIELSEKEVERVAEYFKILTVKEIRK